MIAAAESAGLLGPESPRELADALLAQAITEDAKNVSGGFAKAVAFARIFLRPKAQLGTPCLSPVVRRPPPSAHGPQ